MSQEAELRLQFQYVQPSMDKIYCIESLCKPVSHLPPPARLTMMDQSCNWDSICERFNNLSKFVNIKLKLKYTNSRNVMIFQYTLQLSSYRHDPYKIFLECTVNKCYT